MKKGGPTPRTGFRSGIAAILFLAFALGPACTGGGQPPAASSGISSTLTGCPHAPSSSSPWPAQQQPAGLPADRALEIRGTSSGGQLWALVASLRKLRATIWWATEGVGSLSVVAEDSDGVRVQPKDLSFVQGGVIGWDHPGFQFNSEFQFPHSGCWAMRAIRGPMSGVVWLDLDALADSTVLPSPSGS